MEIRVEYKRFYFPWDFNYYLTTTQSVFGKC